MLPLHLPTLLDLPASSRPVSGGRTLSSAGHKSSPFQQKLNEAGERSAVHAAQPRENASSKPTTGDESQAVAKADSSHSNDSSEETVDSNSADVDVDTNSDGVVNQEGSAAATSDDHPDRVHSADAQQDSQEQPQPSERGQDRGATTLSAEQSSDGRSDHSSNSVRAALGHVLHPMMQEMHAGTVKTAVLTQLQQIVPAGENTTGARGQHAQGKSVTQMGNASKTLLRPSVERQIAIAPLPTLINPETGVAIVKQRTTGPGAFETPAPTTDGSAEHAKPDSQSRASAGARPLPAELNWLRIPIQTTAAVQPHTAMTILPPAELGSSGMTTTSVRPSTPDPTSTQSPQQQIQPPAVTRAMQVDQQLRQEHAAFHATTSAPASEVGQVNTSSHTTHAATVAVHANASLTLSSGLSPDNSTQQLPTFGARFDEAAPTAQVIRGLGAMLNQRGGALTLRLDPPELGELRVQMTISRGVVSATFHPATSQAHALLEQNLATLRTSLESQGVTVDRLTVSAQPWSSSQTTRDDQQMSGNHRNTHQHDAAGGESRGRRDERSFDSPRQYPLEDFAGVLGDMN